MRHPLTARYYHLVMLNADERPTITPKKARILARRLKTVAQRCNSKLLAVGCGEEHLHALLEPPAEHDFESYMWEVTDAVDALRGRLPRGAKLEGDHIFFPVPAPLLAAELRIIRRQNRRHPALDGAEELDQLLDRARERGTSYMVTQRLDNGDRYAYRPIEGHDLATLGSVLETG